jgi:hypothetical protein
MTSTISKKQLEEQAFVPGEDCAPILCESTTSLRHNEPLPDFYQSVFGSTSGDHYPFPYHNPKDGRPTRCFSSDDIGTAFTQQLTYGNFAAGSPQRVLLLQYQEEWRVLRQAILYIILTCHAFHQIQTSLSYAPDMEEFRACMEKIPLVDSLIERQGSLFEICSNLLVQLCQRADVIVAVAHGSQQVAQSVFQTNQSTVPPQFTGRAAALFQQQVLLKSSSVTTPSSFQALSSVDTSTNRRRKGSSFFRPRGNDQSSKKGSAFLPKRAKKQETASNSLKKEDS